MFCQLAVVYGGEPIEAFDKLQLQLELELESELELELEFI